MVERRTLTPREWRGTKQKYERIEAFLDNPTRQTLSEALKETWYYDKSINNLKYYLDTNFLDGQTPDEIAETIKEARRTGNPDPVRDLHGFGWATATEFLSALEPGRFALLNSRSVEGMRALGYESKVPNPRSASLSQYREFCEAVREAEKRFPLRQRATEIIGEAPPADTPGYLIADLCFAYHCGEEQFTLDGIQPDALSRLVEDGVIDDQMRQEINNTISDGVLYNDTREFLRAAIRNELD